MRDPITVPELSVHVVTGPPERDPHRQGFSGIYAEVVTGDKKLVTLLSNAKQDGRPILLRCAMLDVSGPITKATAEAGMTKFALGVDDLHYRKPTRSIEVKTTSPSHR